MTRAANEYEHADHDRDLSKHDEPGFDYFECKICGFDSVQFETFNGSEECPLCAGDCVHSNIMSRRTARDTDRPEGKDARIEP
jgi:hypothetical protein